MMYRYNKETLDFERVDLYSKGKNIALAVVSISLLFGFTIVPKAVVKDLSKEDKLIVIREYNEFSEPQLIKKISQLNFRYPYIILAQSYQETGHYKSGIFLENHNLFGMKQAQLRSTLAKGTNRGHAFYENWQDSVVDYALFYSTYLSDIKTEGEYFEYLRQNYAEDPTYVTRLRALINKNNLKSKFN
jgi:uncharacterized FlgJ-related protein